MLTMEPLRDWPRAHGEPLFRARLRVQPADFQVTEQLGWTPEGDGEHDYLWVEKTGNNTEWVARQLARFAEVPARDVGYAGLKDRHAVTRQWFSVPRWHSPDWQSITLDGVQILAVQRHLRKLRRGAHQGNGFRIVLREPNALDPALVAQRLAVIREQGVPNYFGQQRFGRNGANLQLAESWAQGKRLPRDKRSLAISTLRSALFNDVLAGRVASGDWHHLRDGDSANLDGSASVFAVEAVDDALRARCAAMDIHPAIELAGQGSGVVPEQWQIALDRARVEPGTRSLRLPVRDLSHAFLDEGLLLTFSLPRGAFATAVLREICGWD